MKATKCLVNGQVCTCLVGSIRFTQCRSIAQTTVANLDHMATRTSRTTQSRTIQRRLERKGE